MLTGPVILRSSSTEKLVGNEIVAGVSVRSPATSTRRIESSRWHAAVAAAKTVATATKIGSRVGADRARRTLRTCNYPTPYLAATDRADETPGSPRRRPRRPEPRARPTPRGGCRLCARRLKAAGRGGRRRPVRG